MGKKKVVIFGGGIAGLTVAHECIEAGFEVHLFEKKGFFGGKAQGFRDDRGFPVEHATRIILANYDCFLETLQRIPVEEGKTALDHLVPLKGIFFCYRGRKTLIPLTYAVHKWGRLKALFENQKAWGLSWLERLQIAFMIFSYLFKSEERKRDTLWTTSFAKYHQIEKKSPAYREYIETIFNQFIAARSHTLAIILDDLLWKLFDFGDNPYRLASFGNVTNGPTNESLLDPWVKHLARLGVHFHLNSPLEKIAISQNRIEKATVKGIGEIEADAFVLALPYPEARALAPELHLPPKVNLEWSMGFQLYLNEIPPSIQREKAFVNLQDSPWKLLYLLQSPSLWPHLDYPPNIKAVLSGVVTNIYRPGALYQRSLFQCRPEEVKKEILAQLGLDDHPYVSGFSIDPTLRFLHTSEVEKNNVYYRDWEKGPLFEDGFQWLFESPIFIEKPGEIREKITPKTPVDKLFLAGEFVKTTFFLPTMERACESGKRCAKELFETFGVPYPEKRLKRPSLPLGWVRKIDGWLYSLFGKKKS